MVVKRFFMMNFTGLSKRTTSEKLHEAFAAHGEVVHGMFSRRSFLVILFYLSVINSSTFVFAARVVTDRVSGFSKGFGFVRYATLEDAANGIKGMDGKVVEK